MKGFWLFLGAVSWGSGAIPRADKIEAILLVAFIISVCLFWKFPWLSLFTAWTDLVITLLGIIPWADHTLKTFLRQFEYDHLFFIAANLGTWVLIRHRRSRTEITR
jgi:hypothetical protein